ncbi:hypothetical protein GCM10009547_16340 [Sporichthya brevicatena]|uniref:Glutamine amidotransferase domain-containing protein n=1 Tax=Sporichthya brevicatena TaxID=171442 RepID=A0ABN1GNE9_9ACTN
MGEILVVQPDPKTGMDRFETWLVDAGAKVRTLHPYDGDALPERLDVDGLIVLGGRMSVAGPDASPWVAGVRDLLRQGVETGTPTLGLCLGGQLLAQAAGGTVTVGGSGLEAGAIAVDLTPAAADDELFAGVPAPFLTGSFHSDCISELPPGAVLLGGTARYPHQAYRVGERAWGLQFHPELTPDRYLSWLGFVSNPSPQFADELRRGHEDLVRCDAEFAAANAILARRFAGVVRAASLGRRSLRPSRRVARGRSRSRRSSPPCPRRCGR